MQAVFTGSKKSKKRGEAKKTQISYPHPNYLPNPRNPCTPVVPILTQIVYQHKYLVLKPPDSKGFRSQDKCNLVDSERKNEFSIATTLASRVFQWK